MSNDGLVTIASDPDMPNLVDAENDALRMLRDLIRIDTTNTGEPDTTVGEALAAEYVEAALQEVGYEPERFETTRGNRQGVYLRIPGRQSDRGALMLHGHLDVVPAVASEWSAAPFEAEERDGMIWGRGAVDMKDMDAMILATIRNWARTGHVPPRDIVVMFTPDEEAGGWQGGHWIVENRPELLEGVTEAVGEVGGYSVTLNDKRLYLIQTAEKGIAWFDLAAEGTPGHGSFINEDNAVTAIATAITRIADHSWPQVITPTTEAFLREVADVLDLPYDPENLQPLLDALGPVARAVGATLRNTVNPSVLEAGVKVNVVPRAARGTIDGRFLPGHEQDMFDTVDRLLPDGVRRTMLNHDSALETSFDGPTIAAMGAALKAEDPAAHPVPYMLSAGTDAKAWAELGIRCYGFAPLQLPPSLDFAGMFHGIDERVPIDAVRFGVRVLHRFLDNV